MNFSQKNYDIIRGWWAGEGKGENIIGNLYWKRTDKGVILYSYGEWYELAKRGTPDGVRVNSRTVSLTTTRQRQQLISFLKENDVKYVEGEW